MKKRVLFGIAAVFTSLPCNLVSMERSVTATPDAVAAAVAQTLTAIATSESLPTPTITPLATISATPSPSSVLLTVSVDTNCRAGPGKDYDPVDVLLVGETAVVIGRYSPANYWIITMPHNQGMCWLWGQYATIINGDPTSLPEMIPPPSPTSPSSPTLRPLEVTSVRAFVPSEGFQGTCPHTFRVWAEITLSGEGNGTLIYRWRRSDGFVGPQHTLEVSAGIYTMEGEWRVTQDGSYRIQIEILSPTSLTSEWSAFHEVDCH